MASELEAPVDIKWADKLDCPETMKFCCVQLMADGTFRLCINDQLSNRTATRGDVRTLAGLLGIALQE